MLLTSLAFEGVKSGLYQESWCGPNLVPSAISLHARTYWLPDDVWHTSTLSGTGIDQSDVTWLLALTGSRFIAFTENQTLLSLRTNLRYSYENKLLLFPQEY